jgi:ATP phosphoribosyltransferase
MSEPLRFGLPKGRVFDQAIALLSSAGINISPEYLDSRRLIVPDVNGKFSFVTLKPIDIPVYVESGALDAGIVGTDILRELESDVYEPLDLKIGKCKLALAAPNGAALAFDQQIRIATKYPKTAQRFFLSQNVHVQIIRLEGSVEIAPLLGLADAIVDLVETGRTLNDNGLHIIEDVQHVSSKLIINRTAMKLRAKTINHLVSQLDSAVYANP